MCEDSNLQKPKAYTKPSQQGRVTKWLCGGLQIRIRGFKSLPALFILIAFLFLTIFLIKCSANPVINEVMYNPGQSDNYYEWIELYNPKNQSINLSDWFIIDNSGKDYLEGNFDYFNGSMILPSNFYAIITDHGTKIYDNFTMPNKTICIYVDDKSIGNGLGNTGDKIILKNSLNQTIDAVEWIVNYSDVPGSPAKEIEENQTLSRYNYLNDSSKAFFEGEPTLGTKNHIIKKGITEIKTDITNYLIRKSEIKSVTLNVKNNGDFADNITFNISNIVEGWKLDLKNDYLLLNPNETKKISLNISVIKIDYNRYCNITISALSEMENAESGEITLFFEILGPDLCIRKIKVYDEDKDENSVFMQGEIVRIKAFLKNFGKENASNVKACFYYDSFDKENFIGFKYYDFVSKYQKYPSILWNTVNVEAGFHKIYVITDEDNIIEELNEDNNILSFNIEIIDTSPNLIEKQILISEFYYHTSSNVKNEYIKIYNPSKEDVNISKWYFTNKPSKCRLDQNKIKFPNNVIIYSHSFLIITQNASAYKWETRKNPDFEYNVDSANSVSQMISEKSFVLSNKGGAIVIKNHYNHTIDVVLYGESNSKVNGWIGKPIFDSGKRAVYKRNQNKTGVFIDTDTASDWLNQRIYKIGQSDFSFEKISFNGEIITFVSPDSSYKAIVSEIRNASYCIYLNIYEFTNSFLCNELINAILRNVQVNILIDGSPVGGISMEEKYILRRIANYGGKIRFIKSDNENDAYRRYSFNHAKYLIIDNSTTIIESCNWAETGVPRNPSFGNREWGAIIKNSDFANYFINVFLEDWDLSYCDIFKIEEVDLEIPTSYKLLEDRFKGLYKPCFKSHVFTGNFSTYPVFSPDTSYKAIYDMINSANNSIYVQQLYIYKNWSNCLNPFVERLINKSKNGVDVKVILNYNPFYESTTEKCNETKVFLEENGVEVKFLYTNWSIFTNVHNKGMIVDNKSVLISSINWNENSVVSNREAGVIIENEEVAKYYIEVFFYDWELQPLEEIIEIEEVEITSTFDENTIYIIVIFTMTFAIIARDWRKRKWT